MLKMLIRLEISAENIIFKVGLQATPDEANP